MPGNVSRSASYISRIKSYIQRLTSHQGLRKYGANTAWLFGEQLLRMIAGFFVGIWVARYLGPDQFGIFSYSLAFVAIFQGIARLGLDGIVVRDMVKEPEKTQVYLGTAFRLRLIGGCLTVLLILAVLLLQTAIDVSPVSFHDFFNEANIYILIIASGIVFQSFESIDFYYQATVQAKYISIRKLIQLILSSAVRVYLVLARADLVWFVWVTLFDYVSLAILNYLIYRTQKLPGFIRQFDKGVGKRLLKDSWPLLLSSMAIVVYMRIDQIMIKNMLGDREVGLYSAAVKLVEVWYFIPMLITQSLFPAIVNARKVSEVLYYERLQQMFSLLIWVAIVIAVPVALFSGQIIQILYGSSFVEAGNVLSVSIWASVFVFLGVGTSQWLIVEDLQKLGLYRTFGGAIINVVLNLILIPIVGIIGAAFATIVSYAFAAYLLLLFNKSTRPLFCYATGAFLLRNWHRQRK